MKKKLSLRVRLCILSVVLVAFTMIVAVAVMEGGLFSLRNEAKETLVDQSLASAITYTVGKAGQIDARVSSMCSRVDIASKMLEDMYGNPESFSQRDIPSPADYKDKADDGYNIYYLPFEKAKLEDPKLLEELRNISSIENYFSSLTKTSSKFALLSVYTDSGISLGYGGNVSDLATVEEFNPEAMGKDYYLEPKKTKESYITNVYEDSFGRGKMITVSYPYFVKDDFKGVVSADILIEDLEKEIVDSGSYSLEGEIKILLDRNGELIGFSDEASSDNTSFVEEILQNDAISEIVSNDNGSMELSVKNRDVLLAYETSDICGWKFVDILPYDSIIAPSVSFDNTISGINFRIITIFAALLIVMGILALQVCKRMLKPMACLTEEISKINEENIDINLGIKSGDEIELLANKFELALTKVKEYMENLAKVEAERQRIGAELNVATQIQASYLPNIFPPFPDRKEFDIYASMTPAKEVGGDFYDFFFIDHNHLGLVIADVSGKGVGAALFMMISKTFLNGQAHIDSSPAKILYEVNNRLCENNSAEMFVTVWLGIIDLKTGKITASNGGHEYPFIQRAGGNYEIFKDKHGLALGAYPDVKYTEYEISLNEGDAIFVYTDGVAEATDAQNELFGTDRTCAALNSDPNADMQETISNVKAGIDEFVKDAPQFDDITMLALRYFGSEE